MSIIVLLRSLNYGGTERQVVELAKGLLHRGHAVTVAVLYDEGPLLDELRLARVPVALLGKRGRWDVVGFLARLARFLRRGRPQVVYAFLVEPSIVVTLLKPFLRGTRIVWGVRASNVDFASYGWFPRASFQLSRRLAPLADLVIANSWAGAEYHCRQGYPREVMVVVPNGVDVVRFQPDAAAGRRLRAAWGVAEEATVVGLVGRIDPIKDHVNFLEAAAILRRERPDFRFVCVGDYATSYGSTVRLRAAALGMSDGVLWTGAQEDMRGVYNAFDVLCLTSLSEGFPNVLGEAMACGVPCVATDVGDSARIVDSCGVVVPPRDSAALAEGIRRILARAGPDLRRACCERIAREFGVERMVARTEELLRACVDASA